MFLGIGTMCILSYKTTDGNDASISSGQSNIIIPLKQSYVIVATDYSRVKSLLKKGFICEDVDLAFGSNTSVSYHYTMVKY